MEKIIVLVGLAVLFGLVQVFITNPIAQKILPTAQSDGFGRRVGFRLIHRLVLVAFVLAAAGVMALF